MRMSKHNACTIHNRGVLGVCPKCRFSFFSRGNDPFSFWRGEGAGPEPRGGGTNKTRLAPLCPPGHRTPSGARPGCYRHATRMRPVRCDSRATRIRPVYRGAAAVVTTHAPCAWMICRCIWFHVRMNIYNPEYISSSDYLDDIALYDYCGVHPLALGMPCPHKHTNKKCTFTHSVL